MNSQLTFLWHMHQPYYRNMRTGHNPMPWVRLHGIHSYYDMLKLHETHPEIHATINFVPCLIRQLHEYVYENATDEFLNITMTPAEQLTEPQQEFILRNFFSANPEHMIFPHHRFRTLFERRGLNKPTSDLTEAIRFYTTQDYRDIQVLFNLVWFGFTAREEYPEIRLMLDGQGMFTEDDKRTVIDLQKKVLGNVLDLITRLASSNHVEISTTPFHHPILPLMIDSDIARRCMPKASLPERFSAPDLAEYQVRRAVEFMEASIGKRPRGMWPAEGAVCPEMIPMLASAGISWMASDEGILRNSQTEDAAKSPLHVYTAEFEGRTIAMVFRHRELSDKISFVYGRMKPDDAVADFVQTVHRIDREQGKRGPCLITVILDGENPWEHYTNGGKDFLQGLCAALPAHGIQTTTISRFIDEYPPSRRIDSLASGSWINANFAIWIGKPQKNRAWEYLRRALDHLSDAIAPRSDLGDPGARALEALGAAYGSDWFWWYDDDFSSIFKATFDEIFRGHLENVFNILDIEVPPFLLDPIYHYEDRSHAVVVPPAFIYPDINGISDSYFEWANALRIDVDRFGGQPAPESDPIRAVYFGYNEEAFFLRFDPRDPISGFDFDEGDTLVVSVFGTDTHYLVTFTMHDGTLHMTDRGPCKGASGCSTDCAIGRIIELKCAFACLGCKPETMLTVSIVLRSRDVVKRRYAHVRFVVPSPDYEQRMWSV